VALSREEQRLLEEMEAALRADDATLDVRLRDTGRRRPVRWLTVLGAAAGFLAGLALLLVGMSTTVTLSVVGYVVMVAAAVAGASPWIAATRSGCPRTRPAGHRLPEPAHGASRVERPAAQHPAGGLIRVGPGVSSRPVRPGRGLQRWRAC
jgi:hypothetical protein